mgnify:FL=1
MSSIIKVDTIQTAAGGTPTAADLGLNVSGGVLQTLQDKLTSQVEFTASAWTDSGLEISITPTASTSKFLINAVHGVYANDSSTARLETRIFRSSDSTEVAKSEWSLYRDGSTYKSAQTGICLLDAPNTTSTVTYKLQAYNSGNTVSFQVGKDNVTLTVQEIAG